MSDETPDDDTTPEPAPDAPLAPPQLRVVRGEPDAEQLAALLAVVAATGGGEEPAAPPARGRWADPAAFSREVGRPGPGGWRAAGR